MRGQTAFCDRMLLLLQYTYKDALFLLLIATVCLRETKARFDYIFSGISTCNA